MLGRQYVWTMIAPSGTFVALDSGAYHSCAISSIGDIECWGDNMYDQGMVFWNLYKYLRFWSYYAIDTLNPSAGEEILLAEYGSKLLTYNFQNFPPYVSICFCLCTTNDISGILFHIIVTLSGEVKSKCSYY